MRHHPALHLLSGVVYHRFGSGITGGQIYSDRARMDVSLPAFSRGLALELLDEVNRRAEEGLRVRSRSVPRAELLEDPALVRVARELLPDVDPVRLVELGTFDRQADGGTHVRSTRELGRARLDRIENKGVRHKRLYRVLDEPTSPDPTAPQGQP
jgi:misacylated tRNA(Ala) deacylase